MARARIPDEQLSADLLTARELYALLPGVDIKFDLVAGHAFLAHLYKIRWQYTITQLAQALQVTNSTVYSMTNPKRVEQYRANPPLLWPTNQDMASVNRAWAKLRGGGHGYLSREHLAMHLAINALLARGFTLKVIGRKMRVPVAKLEKYLKAPAPPDELSRRIQQAVAARTTVPLSAQR